MKTHHYCLIFEWLFHVCKVPRNLPPHLPSETICVMYCEWTSRDIIWMIKHFRSTSKTESVFPFLISWYQNTLLTFLKILFDILFYFFPGQIYWLVKLMMWKQGSSVMSVSLVMGQTTEDLGSTTALFLLHSSLCGFNASYSNSYFSPEKKKTQVYLELNPRLDWVVSVWCLGGRMKDPELRKRSKELCSIFILGNILLFQTLLSTFYYLYFNCFFMLNLQCL